MLTERKTEAARARASQRHFDDPEVRSYLDGLEFNGLWQLLGSPRIATIFGKTAGKYWRQGDGRPLLADFDPAVMQAIGRCASWRERNSLPGPVPYLESRVHPGTCAWCDFPQEQLLAACEWAVWHSRWVEAEVYVWAQSEEGHGRFIDYERDSGGAPRYEEPTWRDWWALPASEREARIATVRVPTPRDHEPWYSGEPDHLGDCHQEATT